MQVRTLFFLFLSIFPFISLEFLPLSLILGMNLLLFTSIFIQIPVWILYPVMAALTFYLKTLFGLVIIPESTVSFLALTCLAKILGPETGDYKINRLLGFLWAGCFVLFRTDLVGIISLTLTILFILKTLPLPDQFKINIKFLLNLGQLEPKGLLLGIFNIIVLFIFFPRIHNFLPSARSTLSGQIGYSKEINNSSAGNLIPSSQTAFFAQMNEISAESLYWRGRVHLYTDGYNWKSKQISYRKENLAVTTKPMIYNIKYEQDFDGDLILLDTPLKIMDSNLRAYKNEEFDLFRAYNKNKKVYLQAQSILTPKTTKYFSSNLQEYLQLPSHLTNALKPLLLKLKSHKDLEDLLLKFKNFLNENGFVYTLTPGNLLTLKSFLEAKKGFCTHYASLLGIVLRHFGYPARLISGFQGGEYNSVGQHYRISSNDAHAWVEVYNQNRWLRVDPTAYVVSERIKRGGEAFITGAETALSVNQRHFASRWFYTLKQYWNNINYNVSLFFDTYDRERQEELSQALNFKKTTFILIGLILLIILFIYYYFINTLDKNKLSRVDINFRKFCKKMSKRNIIIKNTDSLENIWQKIEKSNIIQKEECLEYMKVYEMAKYSSKKTTIQLDKKLNLIK